MAVPGKRCGADTAAAAEEEERLLMEEMTVLDFDMLCSTVAMQAHKGKWGKLNGDNSNEEEDNLDSDYDYGGGGVHRMWEGDLVYDFLQHRPIALQSTCCPCYRFGKNMRRAGFGSCFAQGFIYLVLALVALFSLVAFIVTRRCYFLYLCISFTISAGLYLGYYRIQIRNKFNVKGGESSFDDCVYHLICPCCTISQESRTMEMNNVEDGIWHGRGDSTICIGSKPFINVSTKSPEFITMHKITSNNDSARLSAE
ncbi:hypothetical protein ABFS83_13G115400 [Erythranthe nasuta]